jgi:hypothetical protein
MSPRALFAAPALVAATLAACVVVPIDPATGQPVGPYAPYAQPQRPAQAVTIVQPAAPPPPATVVLTARLYPLNEQANRGGLLTAVVTDHQSGRGSFSVGYGGEMLQGEATRVDGGYASFGRVHAEVLGPAARAYSGRRGVANGYGGRGVNVQCEYLITGPGIGTGACLFSDGAKYQLHFGG